MCLSSNSYLKNVKVINDQQDGRTHPGDRKDLFAPKMLGHFQLSKFKKVKLKIEI